MMQIGIFDSGVGGLTVVRAVLRALPDTQLVYFGDTARVPYGTKSKATVRRFAREDADFLMGHQVDQIVVACNTASSWALDDLTEHLPVPVTGVIEAGVSAALTHQPQTVGVIGTPSTIASEAYTAALQRQAPHVRVVTQSCPLFVPLAEEGWFHDPVTLDVARRYLNVMVREAVDVLILGCTHYPLLQDVIARVMGDSVTLVDSAQAVAQQLAQSVGSAAIEAGVVDAGRCRFFVSDEAERFRAIGERFLGIPIMAVEQVEVAAVS